MNRGRNNTSKYFHTLHYCVIFILLVLIYCYLNQGCKIYGATEKTEEESSSTIGVQSVDFSSDVSNRESSSEVLYHLGAEPKATQFSEINLNKGSLGFTEVDLNIPGFNGVDLTISRTYNSGNYRSVPLRGVDLSELGGHEIKLEKGTPEMPCFHSDFSMEELDNPEILGGAIQLIDIDRNGKLDIVEIHKFSRPFDCQFRVGWDFGENLESVEWSQYKRISLPHKGCAHLGLAEVDFELSFRPDLLFYSTYRPLYKSGGSIRSLTVKPDIEKGAIYHEPKGVSMSLSRPINGSLTPDRLSRIDFSLRDSSLAVGKIDMQSGHDAIMFSTLKKGSKILGQYQVGFNLLEKERKFEEISEWIEIPLGFGSENSGAGVALEDIDQNGRVDLIVQFLQKEGPDQHNYYYIGWNLSTEGKAEKWQKMPKLSHYKGREFKVSSINTFRKDGQLFLLQYSVNKDGGSLFYYAMNSKGNVVSTQTEKWGGYAGHGWHFNVGMRAYALLGDSDDDPDNKVIIESNGGQQTYFYNTQSKKYHAKAPGDFSRVSVTRQPKTIDGVKSDVEKEVTWITLETSNGRRVYFRDPFIEESYYKKDKEGALGYHLHITGMLVTNLKNLRFMGPTYVYDYSDPKIKEVTQMPTRSLSRLLGNSIYKNMNDIVESEVLRYPKTKLSYIKNSLGQRVDIQFKEPSEQQKIDLPYLQQISKLSYDNINGGTNEIKYDYDEQGKLLSVQLNDLPKTRYEYEKVDPTFPKGKWQKDPFLSQEEGERYFSGDVLSKITTPKGATMAYNYSASPVFTVTKGYLLPDSSYPVVISKEISAGVWEKSLRYEFDYGQGSYIPRKDAYHPPYSDNPHVRLFYFDYITVKTPKEENDERYRFKGPFLIEKNKGVYKKTEIEWDEKNSRKIQVMSFDRGLKKRVHYKKYDAYGNVLIKETFRGREVDEAQWQPHLYPWHMLKNDTIGIPFSTVTTSYEHGEVFIKNNILNLPKKVITKEHKEGREVSASFEYDPLGRVTKMYRNGDLIKEQGYNEFGFIDEEVIHKVSEKPLKISYGYKSEKGQVYIKKDMNNKSEMRLMSTLNGKLLKWLDLNKNMHAYQYDDLGRLLKLRSPEGREVSYTYPDLLTSTITQSGLSTSTYSDSWGRVIMIDHPPGRLDEKRSYYYKGAVEEVFEGTYPSEWRSVVKYKYDSELNPLEKQVSDFGTSKFTEFSSHSGVTDPQGRYYLKKRNKMGQVITELMYEQHPFYRQLGGSFTTDEDTLVITDYRNNKTIHMPPDKKVTHEYDHWGNRIKTTDARGIVRQVKYDEQSRLLESYHTSNDESVLKVKQRFAYNNYDKVESLQLFDVQGTLKKTLNYDYDPEGRLLKTKLNQKEVESYNYDASQNGLGKLSSHRNEWVNTSYAYNREGAVQEISREILLPDMSRTQRTTSEITYSHDKGLYQSFHYKGSWSRSLYQVNYEYNQNNQLDSMKYYQKSILDQVRYNEDGRIKGYTLGNGLVVTYLYEDEALYETSKGLKDMREGRRGNLTNITVNDLQGREIYSQKYIYDTQNRIKETTYTDLFQGETKTRKYIFTKYDELSDVEVVLGEIEPINIFVPPSERKVNKKYHYRYQYDIGGNRSHFQNPAEPQVSKANHIMNNNNDQLKQRIFEKGTLNYTYDSEGNMIKRKDIDNAGSTLQDISYSYNYQGSLSEVKLGDWAFAKYYYDTNRQRVGVVRETKSGEKETQIFHWDDKGQIIGQGDDDNIFNIRYFYKGNEKIAMLRKPTRDSDPQDKKYDGAFYYFINNLQGTPVAITNENGQIVQRLELDEYGNIEKVQGEFGEEINFTGKRRDYETGMYYFNQRYYHPEIGRFISEDPAAQLLNPYVYAGNNPLMFVDPDGEWFVELLIAAMKAAGISASMNAGFQLIVNGEIDWQDVGTAALRGAAMGGLSAAYQGLGGPMLEIGDGAFANIAESALRGGISNVTYNWVSGQGMSQNDMWNTFSQGAGMGAAGGALKELYRKTVGYGIDYGSGGEAAEGKTSISNPWGRGVAVEGANNIGFAKDFPNRGVFQKAFTEGGMLSRGLNMVPGMNALSGLHDALGKYDWGYGFLNVPGTLGTAAYSSLHVYSTLYSDYHYAF